MTLGGIFMFDPHMHGKAGDYWPLREEFFQALLAALLTPPVAVCGRSSPMGQPSHDERLARSPLRRVEQLKSPEGSRFLHRAPSSTDGK